ncbi:MAG TPA: NAD(P)H-dependent oxidoreductase subunit E [Phycisphaerae bacterium]
MAWPVIDRKEPAFEPNAPPELDEPTRAKIRSFFPRYETKRAALLPALHVVQDTLGHVSWKAMVEIAQVLEIHPSDVFDTISFYTHFWTHHRGKKVITVCRSIACELLGANEVLETLKHELGIDEHQTTPDGKYSLVTEECIAACEYAPCLLINERLHRCVKSGCVKGLLAEPENDKLGVPRSDLFDAVQPKAPPSAKAEEAGVGRTSDIREMQEAG